MWPIYNIRAIPLKESPDYAWKYTKLSWKNHVSINQKIRYFYDNRKFDRHEKDTRIYPIRQTTDEYFPGISGEIDRSNSRQMYFWIIFLPFQYTHQCI